MKSNSALALFLLYWASFAAAAAPRPAAQQLCVAACNTALSSSTFAGKPSALDGAYLEQCSNRLHVQSEYACARRYCSQSEITAGIAYLSDICEVYGKLSILPYSIVQNLSADNIRALPTVAYGDDAEITTTTVPDQPFFDLGYRTLQVWSKEQASHHLYGESLFIFWAGVICFGVLHRVCSLLLWPYLPAFWRRFCIKFRAVTMLSPTIGHHCDEPIASFFTFPSRFETFIIVGYVLLNFVLSAVTYELFPDNLYYPQTNVQLQRYIADRMGYLSYANLPLIWLFGTRNNILIWVTGWSFATYNRFHRWIARIATLEVLVHAIARTLFEFENGGYAQYVESWSEQYYYTGNIAAIAMCLMMGFSFAWLRRRVYDFFLLTHIILALITLVNLFYHTKIFLGEFDGFLWSCVAVWTIDRLLRLIRIISNLHKVQLKKSTVEFDIGARLVRINLPDEHSAPNVGLGAGSYYFVYMLNRIRFWESHPFTLVCWQSSTRVGREGVQFPPEEGAMAIPADKKSAESDFQWHKTLMIRQHRGFTSLLAERALSKAAPRIIYEGPYGAALGFAPDVSDVLFVIGGSGISVATTAIYHLLSRATAPKIHLIWAVRHKALLTSVLARELCHAMPHIEIDAFVTEANGKANEEHAIEEAKPNDLSTRVKVDIGRPDVRHWIREMATSATHSLHVVVCGPASMMDDVRCAVIEQLKEGNDRLQLSLERFSW